MKAWEHQDRLRTHEALGAWLTQTVVHEALGVHRRRQTDNRVLERQAQNTAAWHTEPLDGEERRAKVLVGVAELPDAVRSVIVLRLLEGMSGNQTAELLQCSAAEVSRRLHQGMEMLRGKLSERPVTTGDL